MTETDRAMVEREDRKLNWILRGLGLVLTISLAGGGWMLSQEREVAELRKTTEAHSQQIEAISERLEQNEAARASDSLAVARIEERLAAQSDSIKRIERSVGELVRYLRERDLPQPR